LLSSRPGSRRHKEIALPFVTILNYKGLDNQRGRFTNKKEVYMMVDIAKKTLVRTLLTFSLTSLKLSSPIVGRNSSLRDGERCRPPGMALHSLETRILLLLVSMRLMRLSNIYAKIAAET
jgi:hypothetical protein